MTPDQEPHGSRDNLEQEIRQHAESLHRLNMLTTEDLVASLTAEHHLHTHGLDFPGEQVHRRTGAHRRHVVGLEVVDHIRDRIETFLHSEGVLVVYRAQEMRSLPRRQQVR